MSLELVAIVDGRSTRTKTTTQVQRLLDELRSGPVSGDFERTLGDELQTILEDAGELPLVLEACVRHDCWLGVGIGPVEERGRTALESTGTAFRLARGAVERAKRTPTGTSVAGVNDWAALLDDAVVLYASILRDRTAEGWEAVQLHHAGLPATEIARRLEITPQAVSKRLRAAHYRHDRSGRELVGRLALLAVHDRTLAEA
jgi:hypothetical protein